MYLVQIFLIFVSFVLFLSNPNPIGLISGIADMDLADNLLDDLDYIGDCITSCNKVENYLMLSEFENNLIAEIPIVMDRKGMYLFNSRTLNAFSFFFQ